MGIIIATCFIDESVKDFEGKPTVNSLLTEFSSGHIDRVVCSY